MLDTKGKRMARSAKSGSDKTTAPESPEDAVPSMLPGQDDASPPKGTAEPVPLADAVLIVDPVTADPPPQDSAPRSDPEPPPRPAAANPPAKKGNSGFVGTVLGGVVAAGLGYVAAWQGYGLPVTTPPDLTPTITAQTDRITALEAEVAALPPPDLSPLTAEIAALRDELTITLDQRLAGFDASLAALDDRITALERVPAADGTLSDAAIAGWQAEIDALRAEIATQETRLQSIADEAAARLDAAQTAVSQIEEDASATAMAALQRAAVSRMQAALDAGTPFDAALGDLATTGITVPPDLSAVAADGVPTTVALSDAFPDAARAALATARAEGLADDGDGRVMSFLRRQLGVRSVAPREGSDPDAILSRAEAAVNEGRLADALAEIAALPEVVRADLAGWVALAEGRVAAVAALQSLSETLPPPDASN